MSFTEPGMANEKKEEISRGVQGHFSAIFDFHFHENPRFRDEFQALASESATC